MQLDGRVALVTGAGSGIGRAAALLLAREGAKIAALGHTADQLHETVGAIAGAGGEALPLVADIADPAQLADAARRVDER